MTVFSLALCVIASPRHTLDLLTTLVGIAAIVALVAGFGPRGSLSLKPWLFTTIAIVTYGTAIVISDRRDMTLLLNMAGVAALAGAIAAAYSQRALASINDRVEAVQTRNSHRARWGAAMVASALAMSIVAMQIQSWIQVAQER